MALIGHDRDYFGRCCVCKSVFDLVNELSGFRQGDMAVYFDTYGQLFECRECFGVLKNSLTSCRHLLGLRLKADNLAELLDVAGNIKYLIRGYSAALELPSPETNHFKRSALQTDDNAMHLLKAYGDSRYHTHTALQVTGDGDCLFNSVSLALWLTEDFSDELRLRTALEIITNKPLYDFKDPAYVASQQGYSFEFDDFNNFVIDALKIGSDMSPAHLVALVNTLGVPLALSAPMPTSESVPENHQLSEINCRISLLTNDVEQLVSFSANWSVHMTTMKEISPSATYEDVNSIIPNHYCILLNKDSMHNDSEDPVVPQFLHPLPFGKPFRAVENLHVLHHRGTELTDPNGLQQYSQNLIGKYYLCTYGHGRPVGFAITDGFAREGTKFTYKGTKKRIYYSNYGRFCEVKLNAAKTNYFLPNGNAVPFADYSKLSFFYHSKRSYGTLSRTACWLTDSNWICNGTLLVMYSELNLRGSHNTFTCARASLGCSSFSSYVESSSLSESLSSNTSATETSSVQHVPTDQSGSESNSLTNSQFSSADAYADLTLGLTPSPTLSESENEFEETASVVSVEHALAVEPVPIAAISDITNGKFLPTLEAYDLLMNVSVEPLEEVPRGLKINKRYVVNRGYSRNHASNRNVYIDDSYASASGRTVTVHYSMPSRTIIEVDNESNITNATPRIGRDILGDGGKIKIIKRQSRIEGGRRCVTWATDDDTGWESDVLWEYLEGESVIPNSPSKVRTHPNSYQHKLPELQYVGPKKVYRKCVVNGENVFKNSKQVENVKALAKKRNLKNSGGCSSRVYGDQVQAMLSAQAKGTLPISTATTLGQGSTMFILSRSYCYGDIGRFCMSHTALKQPARATKKDNHVRQLGVMGIDKTFNLTAAHVTTIVYQNLAIQHRLGTYKGHHPYFLGPVLIHEKSSEDIFRHFLEHIDIELSNSGYTEHVGPKVIICDGETAIRNAIKKVWPATETLHCHLHIIGDLLRRLRKNYNSLRFSGTGIRVLNDEIMRRDSCLAKMTTLPSFERKALDILQIAGNHDPDDEFHLQDYLEKQIFAKMRENLVIVLKFPEMNLLGLTNNFTESLNTELKRRVDFQTVSLTEFATVMDTHEYQFRPAETVRAILGKGDYKLHSYFETEFGPTKKTDLWYSRTTQTVHDEAKKLAYLQKFQRTHLPANYGIVERGGGARSTSSDGRLVTVVPSSRAAKKPGKRQTTSRVQRAKRRKLN